MCKARADNLAAGSVEIVGGGGGWTDNIDRSLLSPRSEFANRGDRDCQVEDRCQNEGGALWNDRERVGCRTRQADLPVDSVPRVMKVRVG